MKSETFFLSKSNLWILVTVSKHYAEILINLQSPFNNVKMYEFKIGKFYIQNHFVSAFTSIKNDH